MKFYCKETFTKIKQHKVLFFILMILHIMFISTMLMVVINTQTAVLEDLALINEKISNANFNAEQIQAGQPFLAEAAQIQAVYSSFKERLLEALFALGALVILGNTAIWLFAFRFFERNVKKRVLKLFVIYLLGFILLSLLGYSLMQQYISQGISLTAIQSNAKLFLLGFLLISYMVILATLNSHRKWSRLLINSQNLLKPYVISVVSITLGLLILYRITNSTYANWLPITFVLYTILLSYIRIYFITSYEKSNS